MANTVSSEEIFSGLDTSGGAYIGSEEKEKMYKEQIPFAITNAIPEQEGNYGPQTIFVVRMKGKPEGKLSFGPNAKRKALADRINAYLAKGYDQAGPFYLGRWTNGTRSGWDIFHEKQEVQEYTPAQQDAEKRESKPAFDDDLPF